jgi:hypothetical protein
VFYLVAVHLLKQRIHWLEPAQRRVTVAIHDD